MRARVHEYFFGEDFDIREAHWSDQVCYFGLPAASLAGILLAVFI